MPNYNDDPNMVPLMRMSPYGGYADPIKRYSPIAKLTKKQETLQKAEKSAPKPSISKNIKPIPVSHTITSNIKPIPVSHTINSDIKKKTPLPRKNKFCGGASKPYGKKK